MSASSPMATNAQGALWASVAACLIGVLSLLVRKIAGELHPFEIAFFRNLGQLVLMVPWVLYAGISVLHTKRPWAHVRRSVFGIMAMLSWFWVITQMPLAEATAISFSAPLFTTFGAALFLGEKVGLRRWVATGVGFCGVLLIIRPGFQDVDTPHVVALVTAALIAGAMLSNKSLTRTEQPNAMVVWMGVFMSLFSLPPALGYWQWPSTNAWLWLGIAAVVATAAHLALNRSYKAADASFVAPFGYVQIPFVAVLGFWAYGEIPDVWSWTGAVVIGASGIYIARRESYLAKVKHKSLCTDPEDGAAIVEKH
ncbi:DMT family transporter [Magnetovibrio sp. PR-2]|uniref:DMT family transporter n=1 Tax=Magnetovibrio sp. PR-2 TaxID=3120356 RepID=UPI002FCE4C7A